MAEARTDVKVSALEQKISGQTGELIKWILGTGFVGVLTIVGVIIGVLAYGGDRFDGGVQGASLTVQQSEEATRLARQNAEQIRALGEAMQKRDNQIDALIDLMERRQQ